MTRDGKNFLQMASVSAIVVVLFYLLSGGDPPQIQSAASSGMEGVEKAIDSVDESSVEITEISESEIKTLLDNQDYRELMANQSFKTLIKSAAFRNLGKDQRFWKYMMGLKSSERYQPSSDFKANKHFQAVIGSPEFKELRDDPAFISLLTESTFITIVQSGQIEKLESLLAE